MRIGINGSTEIVLGAGVDTIAQHAAEAEADGFSSYWLAQLDTPDALTALAIVGRATSTIELGTAVISIWLRHPLMLAAQAMTCQEIIGNRLVLGIGLAHQPMIEGVLGMAWDKPASRMDEYLSVMTTVMRERRVDFRGAFYTGVLENVTANPGAEPPSVMLAAMGPRMLRMAATRTDGTILWLAGPKAIRDHVGPSLAAARPAADGPARIVASVPVCVTDDASTVKETIAALLGSYNDLPSYRGIMDLDDAAGPQDVSVVGTEEEVRAGIQRFADAGVTDFAPVEFPGGPDDAARTRALLKAIATE
jgi:F420-dependent oxidoreductase-like protein